MLKSFLGSGNRFEVTLNNNQKWIIYSSKSIPLSKSGDYVLSSSKFTGHLRVAGVWIGKEGEISILDQYSSKVPVGGVVSAVSEGKF